MVASSASTTQPKPATYPRSSSAAPVTVRKADSKEDFKAFFEFPWTVYKNDPNWVPPLLSMRSLLLDKKKNPEWEYMIGDYFVAWRGAEPVGTIAAFVNHHHNQHAKENIGWFGFFDCYDDQEAATALLKQAIDHVRSLGATDGILGPASPTLNDECALLIDGFTQPVVLMPYNPPYYQKLIEQSGLGLDKFSDLYSWYSNRDLITQDGGLPEKLVRVVKKTQSKYKIELRKPDPRNLRKEVGLIRELYDAAWAGYWYFYPLTGRETEKLFKELADFIDPDLVRFASFEGKEVGFLIALPDMNQVLKLAYPRPGEPEIWTLLKVVWHWKIRPKITGQRILLMGVKPEYRAKGVEASMNLDFFEQTVTTRKYYDTDSGWVLDSNQPMNQLAITFKAEKYKTYRFYKAPLTPASQK